MVMKMPKLTKTEEKLRRILRNFWNESYYKAEGDEFVPHAGDDPNCSLCKIEKKAIKKIQSLLEKTKDCNECSIRHIEEVTKLNKRIKEQEKQWQKLYNNIKAQCNAFIDKCKKQEKETERLRWAYSNAKEELRKRGREIWTKKSKG